MVLAMLKRKISDLLSQLKNLTVNRVCYLIRSTALDAIPKALAKRYEFKEWNHSAAILAGDFPEQWADLLECLGNFCLRKSVIMVGGGGRSQIPMQLDGC